MDDKSNSPPPPLPPASRRYHRLNPLPVDEPTRTDAYPQQLIPISTESRPSAAAAAATLSRKRRRCSITHEPSSPTRLPYYTRDFTDDRSHAAATGARKRSAQDDAPGSHTPDFHRSDAPYVSSNESSPPYLHHASHFSRTNDLATSLPRASSSKINHHAHRSIAILSFSIIATNRTFSHRPGRIHQ